MECSNNDISCDLDNLLRENERLDDLDFKGMKIISNPNLYSFTSDSVILANIVKGNSKHKIVELCAGGGIIALLIAGKTTVSEITCVEIQECMSDMCERSIILNNLQNRIKVINKSLIGIEQDIGVEIYDSVVCNPPYYKIKSGEIREIESIAIARHELTVTIKDIITTANKLLKYGGKLYLVHKCERMAEVISLLTQNKLEPKELYCITTGNSQKCDTFVVVAKKGASSGLNVKSIKHI